MKMRNKNYIGSLQGCSRAMTFARNIGLQVCKTKQAEFKENWVLTIWPKTPEILV